RHDLQREVWRTVDECLLQNTLALLGYEKNIRLSPAGPYRQAALNARIENVAEFLKRDVLRQDAIHQALIRIMFQAIWRHPDHFSVNPFGPAGFVGLPIPFDKFLFGHAFGPALAGGPRALAVWRLTFAHHHPPHATSPFVIFMNASSRSASTSLNQTSE